MLLKRHYATPTGWQPRRNERLPNGQLMVPSLGEGDCLNPPPLDYVELKHTGIAPEQNFSEDLIAAALREGWASFNGSALVLEVKPETLVYTVKRTPGRYCLHCGARTPDNDNDGAKAREHVASLHAGTASPDPSNRAGYEAIHCYETVLNAEQHGRFKAQPLGEKPTKGVNRG